MSSPVPTSRRVLPIAGLLVGALALGACSDAEFSFSWDSETVDGNGNPTTETYEVSDFEQIEICCDLNVQFEIESGSDKIVEITIDDNLHSYLDIDVEGDDLQIRPKKNTHLDPTGDVVVRLSGYEIDGLEVDTSSSVTGDFPATDTFTVRADTAATVRATIDTDRLVIRTDTAADVILDGRATTVDIEADTAANVYLAELDGVVDVDVDADTAANVEVEASGTVTGHADTSAAIEVWGSPSVDVSTDTSGSVHRRN